MFVLYCVVLLLQLSAMDVSAQTTMKGVAKCDKHFELQSSVSQQNLERTLRSQEIPESTPASVPTAFATSQRSLGLPGALAVCYCASKCVSAFVANSASSLVWLCFCGE